MSDNSELNDQYACMKLLNLLNKFNIEGAKHIQIDDGVYLASDEALHFFELIFQIKREEQLDE